MLTGWLSSTSALRVQWTRSDLLFAGVFVAMLAATVTPWWISKFLPMMDYAQFLTFVRAAQDVGDPSSPFYGTYEVPRVWAPLAAPVSLTRMLSVFGDVEMGGRILMTGYAVGLPCASLWLLRVAGAERWNVLWVFPLVFSRLVGWGFFGYVTALPLVLLLTVVGLLFLRRPTFWRGSGVAVLVLLLAFWHGLAVCVGAYFYGVLWLCWRAPSWRARLLAVLPLSPAFLLFMLWRATFISAVASTAPPFQWLTLESTFDTEQFFNRVFIYFPNAPIYAKVAILLLVLGVALSRRDPPSAPKNGEVWRFYPLPVLAWASLLAYFVLPYKVHGVEVVNYRFIWLAALLLTLSGSWPKALTRRWSYGMAIVVFSSVYLADINTRFLSFHYETVGASKLIDQLAQHDTLIAPLSNTGTSAFPIHHPIRDVQLYATIRRGGLPTQSFADSPGNYVRYVNGRNPMPFLRHPNWLSSSQLTRFDYVLLRDPPTQALTSPRLKLIAHQSGWSLFAICHNQPSSQC